MPKPNDRKYSADHVWVLAQDDGSLLLGITAQAAEALGNIERIELPPTEERIVAAQACGNIESIKSVSDLVAPLDARVAEHNEEVILDPPLINDDPYGRGWLIRLDDYDATDYDELPDADAYQAMAD